VGDSLDDDLDPGDCGRTMAGIASVVPVDEAAFEDYQIRWEPLKWPPPGFLEVIPLVQTTRIVILSSAKILRHADTIDGLPNPARIMRTMFGSVDCARLDWIVGKWFRQACQGLGLRS